MYKVNILKQDYSEIELININTNDRIKYDGISRGLFHNDEVNINEDGSLKILFSSLPQYLVGILELYSSHILKSNTNTPVYLFKPLNRNYPKFYVHSKCRSKYNKNIIVSIQDLQWNLANNYPNARLLDVYGEYDNIEVIEDALCDHYELIDNNYRLKNIPIIKYGCDLSRININENIYSIDPDGCKDIDDAFSIKEDNNGFHLWIHISDVYSNLMSWFDDASYIISHLHQGSSIYLRKRIRHMLSGVWATNICSLLEGTTRNMMTLYINLLNDGSINYNFYISEVKITKNYNYDNSIKLFRNYFNKIEIIYKFFMKETGQNINEPIIINDTHKFIEALMIIYNIYFGNVIMNQWPYRLLRIQKNKKNDIDLNNYDKDLLKFMFSISNASANYIITKDLEKHDTIGVYGYTHATSPIRRKIDLINQMLYYNKDIIKYGILEGIIGDINKYEKKMKRLTRDINKLYLLERVYNSPNYNTNCYIYSSNIEKNRMSLYFSKEKLSFKINIIRNEVKDIVEISKYENKIIIKEKASNNQKEIELYKLLKVCINGIPLIDKIDEMLMIEFL